MYSFVDNNSIIGILGGTFNPIHSGHIMMAKEALSNVPEIESVIFMPISKPPHKAEDNIVSDSHRINMINLAIADVDKVSVSDLEINRGGYTYTIDTIKQIQNEYPNVIIYLIIGTDSFLNFRKWKDYMQLLKLVKIVVINRDSNKFHKAVETKNEFISDNHGLEIILINSKPIDISSSQIRDSVTHGREINSDVIDEKVYKYIIDNNLYI